MACRKLAFVERGLHVWGELREFQTAINISGCTADGGCERFHGVALGISPHERPVSQSFIQLVDVFTLNVLNDGEFQCFSVVEAHDTGGDGFLSGGFRGSPAPLSANNLIIASGCGTDDNRLQDTTRLDARGQLCQGGIVDAAAGIGFEGFKLVEADFLDKAVLWPRRFRRLQLSLRCSCRFAPFDSGSWRIVGASEGRRPFFAADDGQPIFARTWRLY